MTKEVFLLLICVPLGLALLCGAAQGALTVRLKGELLRAALLGLVPVTCGLAALYALLQLLSASGWDVMERSFYLIWAAAAFAGAVLGWLIGGHVRRKKRKQDL